MVIITDPPRIHAKSIETHRERTKPAESWFGLCHVIFLNVVDAMCYTIHVRRFDE